MSYLDDVCKLVNEDEDAISKMDFELLVVALQMEYNVASATDYIEPGYSKTNSDFEILLGDWNKIPIEIISLLETEGYDLEWPDEWLITEDGEIVRTYADSYSWKPSYLITDDGDILTIKSSDEDWIEAVKVTDHMQAIHPLGKEVDLEDYGFEKFNIDEYQAGMFPGMNDDPQEVCLEILKQYPNAEVVFTYSTSQFYTTFDAWYRA